jgi:phosphatidylserine/phosphatidylglycerophosphate/cardiolipin synthase-like enzyme
VIWERGVDVEIILSNPGSIPGGLAMTDACYGNGWSCVDVAAEIIKTIRKNYPDADDAALRKKVSENLRVSFIRQKRGQAYDDGKTIGMHAKHFIVDDVCTYVGSQNLYICDLAEWGVVIDDEASTLRIKKEYWDPMVSRRRVHFAFLLDYF